MHARPQKHELDELEASWRAARDHAQKYDNAARSIQTAWRGFRNKRIYRYYRDLIQFRCARCRPQPPPRPARPGPAPPGPAYLAA